MAEGLARSLWGSRVDVLSAGSRPAGVHPCAIAVMEEVGIDIREQESTRVDFVDPEGVDLVITLCQEEVCPVFLSSAERLHWPLCDPAGDFGEEGDERMLQSFRTVRDEIQKRLMALF